MSRTRFLVAYDIRDPKRLYRVHRILKGFGTAMQFSVFVCDLDRMELTHLRAALGDAIHHRADQVAIVHLGQQGDTPFQFLGSRSPLPRSGPTIL